MRIVQALVVAGMFVLACSASPGASTRGEESYMLPAVREPVAPAPDGGSRAPVWIRELDTPPDFARHGDMLAIGSNVVAFATDGKMCGFRSSSGQRLWCGRAGANPAFAADEVAYTTLDGTVRAVNAQSGALQWHADRAETVWAAGAGFLIANTPAAGALDQIYTERDRFGRVLWNAPLPQCTGATEIFDRYAFKQCVGDGAYISSGHDVLRLGERVGFQSSIGDSWEILDVRPALFIYRAEPIEPAEDHSITFDVGVAALRDTSIRGNYHFEPDYAANLVIFNPDNVPGFSAPTVRVDGDDVFAALLSQKIYRYRLTEPATQKPLLVASDARFLGGPYRGWLYVARRDGVWALRPGLTRIRARLVVPSPAKPLRIFAARNDIYVTLADGRVVGVNATTGRTIFSARSCGPSAPESGVATRNDRIFIVCPSESGAMRVSAFQRL